MESRSCTGPHMMAAVALVVSMSPVWITLATAADVTTTRSALGDRSTPQAAMRTLVDAIEREDNEAIAAGVFVAEDADRQWAKAYAQALIAGRRYWHAAWNRWGRQESIEAYVRRGLRLPDSHLDYRRADWEHEGERAILKHVAGAKSLGAPSPLREVDGQWLYDPLGRAGSNEIAASVARINETAATHAKLAADIEAGRFASVHEAIDVLRPRRDAQPEPTPLTKQQRDPKSIPGAMMSLGLAYGERDARAAARFYHVDGSPRAAAQLAEAHAKRLLAVNDFTDTIAYQIDGTEALAMEFDLIDPRDDLFGHLITEWRIKGDRATGRNDAGPAEATMRRVGGIWKIDLTPPRGSPSVEKLSAELRRQTRIVAAVALDVREKRLFMVDEVRAALKQRGLVPATSPAAEGEVDIE
ncbi:MAG: hypothetical protein M3478_08520 [Planctomycetota bacterium]|nr:hypothetical protein [Planctomycetota bacterium]